MVNFHSIQACTGQVKVELKEVKYIVNQKYESMGFNITQYNGNNEFENIRPYLFNSTLHICDADEHIGVIYCAYCTVKEKLQ